MQTVHDHENPLWRRAMLVRPRGSHYVRLLSWGPAGKMEFAKSSSDLMAKCRTCPVPNNLLQDFSSSTNGWATGNAKLAKILGPHLVIVLCSTPFCYSEQYLNLELGKFWSITYNMWHSQEKGSFLTLGEKSWTTWEKTKLSPTSPLVACKIFHHGKRLCLETMPPDPACATVQGSALSHYTPQTHSWHNYN